MIRLTSISSLALAVALGPAWAEVPAATIKSLSAPARVETRIGTLEFKDGVPSAETARTVYDALDFTQRARRLQQQLPRRLGLRASARACSSIGAEDERRRHLLGADGRELAVPDRERRHGLLHVGHRPQRRPDGDRAAVRRRRHDQRHVVLLDHRHRRPRPRPRARRQVPDRAARLRRAAARGRLLRRAFEDQPRALRRARLPRRRRPEAGGRERQGEPEDLPLRAGQLRHQHRPGAGPARCGWRPSRRSRRRSSSRAPASRSTPSRRATTASSR